MAGNSSTGGMVVSYTVEVNDKFSSSLNKFSKKMESVEKKVEKTASSIQSRLDFRKVADNMGALGKRLSIAVTAPIVGFGLASLKAASDVEMFSSSLNIFTGSAKQSAEILDKVMTLSDSSIYKLTEFQNASKTLLGSGTNPNNLVDQLSRLQDIGAVFQMPLETLAQQSAIAKQFGFTIRQARGLAMQGVPIFKELSRYIERMTGKKYSDKEIQKFLSEGRISAKAFDGVLKQMTDQGGIAFKGMERSTNNLRGGFFKLRNAGEGILEDFGLVLNKTFNLSDKMNSLAGSTVNASNKFKEFANTNPALTKNILLLTGALAALPPVLLALRGAVLGFAFLAGVLNPITASIIALGAAVGFVLSNKERLTNIGNIAEGDRKYREGLGMKDYSFSNRLGSRYSEFDTPLSVTSQNQGYLRSDNYVNVNINDPSRLVKSVNGRGDGLSNFDFGVNNLFTAGA